MTSAAAVTFGFVNAKTFASEEQIDEWKREVEIAARAAPKGLKKQLDKQIELFADENSVEGE